MTYKFPDILPVTTTGAWAKPGWYDLLSTPEMQTQFGPDDIAELYNDYAVLAIRDQESCGLDILTDGETRRFGWIQRVAARLPGVRKLEKGRLLGSVGFDFLDIYELERPLDKLDSVWDYASEYDFARAQTERRIKIGMPGPFAMTTQLDFSGVYRNRVECAEAFVPAIRSDIRRLVAAGCDYIQFEEALTPSVLADNRTAADIVRLTNNCVDGISNCTFILHICFGSFNRLPYAKRSYKDLFPKLLDAHVHGFSIEFAAREMSEIELVGQWDRKRILSAGLIDIKTHYAETPDDIEERVRICLKYRDADRLEISTDCGLTRVPRYLARKKMLAAAAAAGKLRAAL
jgi:5-methyltetrahydropteroyltriglutamate--homocysteine methyltransferase